MKIRQNRTHARNQMENGLQGIWKMDHVVITTADPQSCIAFYQKCGFQLGDTEGRYELLAQDFKINVHVCGRELSPHALNVQPGSADLCFEIRGDLVAFQTQLQASGLTSLEGIVERTGIYGAMHSLYLRDPDGNLIEFCNYH